MSAVPVNRPNIFTYHDYRSFLNDWVGYMKASGGKFSIRKWSKACGLSPAYISLVLSQKRVLSPRSADRLLGELSLDGSERRYFKLLVNLAESNDQDERLRAYQRIKRFDEYQEANQKEVEVFRYMSKWYYVAIRELAAHPEFKGDPGWIQKQLIKHVPAAEIKKALDFLLDNGFLIRGDDGRFSLPDRDVDCLGGVFQLSLNEFHNQILELAAQSIDGISKERRNLSGYTFMMSDASYAEVLEVLERAKREIKRIEARDAKAGPGAGRSVYHVETIVMPLTGRKK